MTYLRSKEIEEQIKGSGVSLSRLISLGLPVICISERVLRFKQSDLDFLLNADINEVAPYSTAEEELRIMFNNMKRRKKKKT